jgi:hypothetical protein
MGFHLQMDFLKIRSFEAGQRDAFEELCCQIMRIAPEAPKNGTFRRLRGAGGDAGIEAYWRHDNDHIWGIQAKFFTSLRNSEKRQMRGSLDQALATYPSLKRYTFCLPFTLTGKGAGGRENSGQIQKLEEWIAEWQSISAATERRLKIDWWDATELSGRLQAADPFGGRRRYWFDSTILTDYWFQEHLDAAKQQAGNRYSPRLTVAVPAFDALEAFGRTDAWQKRVYELAKKLDDRRKSWGDHLAQQRRDPALPAMPDDIRPDATRLLTYTNRAQEEFLKLIEAVGDPTGVARALVI